MAIVDTFEAGIVARDRGATILQLRIPGQTARSLETAARRLVELSGLPIVVSRRADVALAAGAAGVNLPEGDLSVLSARLLLGTTALVGRSVHNLAGALSAADEGATFLLFGPVFETPSHPGSPAAGLDALAAIAKAVTIPVLAVGGMDPARVEACLRVGAAGHASISMYV